MRWLKSLLSVDSAVIGRRYAFVIGLVAIIGLAAAATLLLELATPHPDILDSSRFGVMLTAHGITMIFLVLIPLFPAVLGNLIIPRAVGAGNTAFPRLNLLGWYFFIIGALAVVIAIEVGGYDGGWKMSIPPEYGARMGFTLLVIGLLAVTVSGACLNLALLVTIFGRRHRSIKLARLPLFVWFLAMGLMIQFAVIPARLWFLLLQLDFLMPSLLTLSLPVDEILSFKQTLFWIYVNPAVLSTILPAVGVACALVGGKDDWKWLPRQKVLIGGLALSLLILVSWGQHLLTAADRELVAVMGSLYGLLSLIPLLWISRILIQAWLHHRTSHALKNTVLLGLVISGALLALSSVVLAAPSLGVHLHNTYVTVSHLHFGAIGIGIIGFIGGVIHWWPWLSTCNPKVSWSRLWLMGIITGLLVTFLPLLVIGLYGVPRAYHEYSLETQGAHILTAIGGAILLVSLIGWMIHCWCGGRKKSYTFVSKDTIPETRSST